LTTAPDSFFALASIVADEMYARPIPLVVLTPEDFAQLRTGQRVKVSEAGQVELLPMG
jgi:predicted aconitase with swiveling domain